MTRDEVLALSGEELRIKVAELLELKIYDVSGDIPVEIGRTIHGVPDYSNDIAAAWGLFESVYGRGGKIKGGAWVLGTVEGGRDVASATLMWKAQSGQKHRVHKVSVIRPRGEMAKAITQAWVCGMLGLSDV